MRCPTCHRRVAIYDNGEITTATATFVMDGGDVVVTTPESTNGAAYPVGTTDSVASYHGLWHCGALVDIVDAFSRGRGAAHRGIAAMTLRCITSTE